MEDKDNASSGTLLFMGIFLFLTYKTYILLEQKIAIYAKDPIKMIVMITICILVFFIFGMKLLEKIKSKRISIQKLNAVTKNEIGAVYSGTDKEGNEIWVKERQRVMHTQVVGTTNAGKTESVILPWAIQDIQQGRGLILIDGKADSTLLEKLWAYSVKAGREKDFRLISLGDVEKSYQFNPLIGGSAEEIAERVFNSFEFENEHYRNLQYETFVQVLRILEILRITPTFKRLHRIISNIEILQELSAKTNDSELDEWVKSYSEIDSKERELRSVGLLTAIGHFSFGKTSILFNAEEDPITINDAMDKGLIVYFQLPVLLTPFLGKATGKLVLQSLQAAIANRHRGTISKKFFSVFLDDFSEYLYPGFVSILNKSRSANVGIVFAHQALGDISVLGEAVANSILTNSNLKVFMRGNDPVSAEYFSKVIGTNSSIKFTERQKKGFLHTEKTGDLSAREVEEFTIHPNEFKRNLGLGEAIVLIPHEQGMKTIKIKFQKFDDLESVVLPRIQKRNATGIGEYDSGSLTK